MSLRSLLARFFNREVLAYLIAGVLTTLVNLAVFTWLSRLFGADRWWLSNFPAILAAIVFAFFSNRLFVFRSRGPLLSELGKFFLSRFLVSLVFEYGAMFLFYELLGLKGTVPVWRWSLSISKLLSQLLVMVANYLFSKWFVFNKPERKQGKQ